MTAGLLQSDSNTNRLAPRRDIDIGLLRTFVAVVETGTLQRASEAVCRTQAAVSLQLKRLEESTGADLFERKGRKLELTNMGERFLSHARSLLESNDQLLEATWKNGALKADKSAQLKRSCWDDSSELIDKARNGDASFVAMTHELGDPSAVSSIEPVKRFEDRMHFKNHRDILELWRERRASGQPMTLNTLVEARLFSRSNSQGFTLAIEGDQIRFVDASEIDIEVNGLHIFGLNASLESVFGSSPVLAHRLKIYRACQYSDVPVFFAGNGWCSPLAKVAEDLNATTRHIERLILPVVLNPSSFSEKNAVGLLVVAHFDERKSYAHIQHGATFEQSNNTDPVIVKDIVFGF